MSRHGWVITLIFGSLGIGLFVGTAVAFVVVRKKGFSRLFDEAPGPKWSFDSWATNMTAGGAALGTVLASTTLSKTAQPLSGDAFVAINLFFGLLVLAGPLLFQCIRNPRKSATDQDAGQWGWNVTLLLACEVTLAAVVGQIAALGLLYWEVLGGGSWGKTVVVVACLIGVAVTYYFTVTVWYLASADWQALATAAATAQKADIAEAFGMGPNTVAVVPSARATLSWKLP
jgi:hypothetical protein